MEGSVFPCWFPGKIFVTLFIVKTFKNLFFSEFFSRIIGKSGENKSQMEKETRTQINVPKKGKSGDIGRIIFFQSVIWCLFPVLVVTGCDHKGVAAAYSQITLLVSSIRKRYPFTHFVSIPLQSSEVKTGLLQFQEDVLSLMKRVRHLLISMLI